MDAIIGLATFILIAGGIAWFWKQWAVNSTYKKVTAWRWQSSDRFQTWLSTLDELALREPERLGTQALLETNRFPLGDRSEHFDLGCQLQRAWAVELEAESTRRNASKLTDRPA